MKVGRKSVVIKTHLRPAGATHWPTSGVRPTCEKTSYAGRKDKRPT